MEKVKIKNSKELKEVYVILSNFPKSELNKLPEKLLKFIEKYKDDDYDFKCDKNFELNEKTALPGTITLMEMIFLNYLSSNNEKKAILKKLDDNELKYSKSLKPLNQENSFTNSDSKEENTSLITMKENIFTKIWNLILNIFRRK